jgi:hypothetical protein
MGNPRGVSGVWINVYELSQSHGGGEEGGWYYTEKEPFLSLKVEPGPTYSDTIEEAQRIASVMRTIYQDNNYRYSAAPGGTDLEVVVERHRAMHEPQHRPTYTENPLSSTDKLSAPQQVTRNRIVEQRGRFPDREWFSTIQNVFFMKYDSMIIGIEKDGYAHT